MYEHVRGKISRSLSLFEDEQIRKSHPRFSCLDGGVFVDVNNKKTQHKVQKNILNSGQAESEVTGEHSG